MKSRIKVTKGSDEQQKVVPFFDILCDCRERLRCVFSLWTQDENCCLKTILSFVFLKKNYQWGGSGKKPSVGCGPRGMGSCSRTRKRPGIHVKEEKWLFFVMLGAS